MDAEKLMERLSTREKVCVIRTRKIECEHCDFYLAGEWISMRFGGGGLTGIKASAPEWCFGSFVEDIERTRADVAMGI